MKKVMLIFGALFFYSTALTSCGPGKSSVEHVEQETELPATQDFSESSAEDAADYVEDYAKNQDEAEQTEGSETTSEYVYEGTVSDPESGYSQDYTMYIRPDLSAASIGGGPYYPVEDQGDGSYMWLDGTIMGMSFRPMQDKCVVYDSDGNYFCTLYRSL
jgi:protocatechuate 3,4-dioxygenase beta subunit